MKNQNGCVIYVGKAGSLKKRLKQYFVPGRDNRPTIPLLLKELTDIDTILVSGDKEALLLENTLIKKHKPKFNILLRDDKNYISLSINPSEKWPRLKWTRSRKKEQDGTLYFGPYTSAKAARDTFELMSRLFPLRQCSDEELKKRTRPCLLYGIKRCIAPCVQKCTQEEYTTFVEGAIDFLKGHNQKVCNKLKEEMQKASDALEFEKAASFLTTLKQIEHVTKTPSLACKHEGKNTDVFGLYREADHVLLIRLLFREGNLVGSEPFFFEKTLEEEEEILTSFLLQEYENSFPEEFLLPFALSQKESILSILQDRHPLLKRPVFHVPQKGEKKELIELAKKNAEATFKQRQKESSSLEELLSELQETLHLSRYPKIIECFDTSNLAGSHLVAATSVFTNGREDKKKTRLYHIKEITKPDDYAALHQVLTRRLIRAKEEDDYPDLLMIDGGKGQLNIALAVLKELDLINIDVISLVKENARHDKGLTQEKVYLAGEKEPIAFAPYSPLLFFLQKIRDTAHAKALSFHKKTRSQKTIQSALDHVPWIGKIKKKKLLEEFGSVKNILFCLQTQPDRFSFLTPKEIDLLKTHLTSASSS